MPADPHGSDARLTGHALRNAHLRTRSLARAESAPPLARAIVRLRAGMLGMTRLELARKSGIGRGTLRDLELGVHLPTRRTLQRFVTFCQQHGINGADVEELRQLYAGPGDSIERFLARLELRAGSSRELARRVGISPATLWEYRRGNFPLPFAMLHRLCDAAGENLNGAESLWVDAERRRLLNRGYPPALAEFWVLCARAGYKEKNLLGLGLATGVVRRLRYLELTPWSEVERIAKVLCRDEAERSRLERLWERDRLEQRAQPAGTFGTHLADLRKERGLSRRELADLFGIGGKKPARIIKHVEEDGFYSAQAYPAGLVAVLTPDRDRQARLIQLWQSRRAHFHRRHRPEMQLDLRLAREVYGFGLREMQRILGYSSLEYQKIERGVEALSESARSRILQALHQAGEGRVRDLLHAQKNRETARSAWKTPTSLTGFLKLLAAREGGWIPLTRQLRKSGLPGAWVGRLKAMAQGERTPAWPVVERIASACSVTDLRDVREDWEKRTKAHLEKTCRSPLAVEVRLLIAEVATSPCAFSPRLGFNYSVLIRDLQRIDRDDPIKWRHVERIVRAAGLTPETERWREIHALWYTAGERRRRNPKPP